MAGTVDTTAAAPAAYGTPGFNPQAALAAQLAKFPGIDPQAELAVAAQEGLGGGIGDAGTSFGPNQLHIGGAYPSWAPQAPQAAQSWAWSPQGIDYALRGIQAVAGGMHGPAAVQALVSRFERPLNPAAEIARALAAYGGAQAPPAAPAAAAAPDAQPVPAAPAASTQAAPAAPTATHGQALLHLALQILNS